MGGGSQNGGDVAATENGCFCSDFVTAVTQVVRSSGLTGTFGAAASLGAVDSRKKGPASSACATFQLELSNSEFCC